MKRIKSSALILFGAILVLAGLLFYAEEQMFDKQTAELRAAVENYPEKPIEMIIVWSAGGGSDLAARLIGSYAAKSLGQPFVYSNVTGKNGDEGWKKAQQAPADGYTIANLTFDILTNQAMGQTDVKYTDFDLICQFTVQPVGIFVSAASPFQSLEELLAAAAERPNEITMATTPLGGFFHQGVTLLENAAGKARFNMVPYKGSKEIIAALIRGKAEAGIQTLTGMEQYMEEEGLRLLAVLTEERLANFPEAPTARELGYDVVYKSWRGFGVPKGTPPEIRQRLETAFREAFNDPEFQQKAQRARLDLVYAEAEDFRAYLDAQYPHVEGVLRQLGFVK
ncbi:MAG: tripartite tricarboxylate transporter substrate binding protein [Peptococcaceae bacterium]|nr:tripartite tricarboxylate transporter substrate binding protein [Peptococcaceae bacterium]